VIKTAGHKFIADLFRHFHQDHPDVVQEPAGKDESFTVDSGHMTPLDAFGQEFLEESLRRFHNDGLYREVDHQGEAA